MVFSVVEDIQTEQPEAPPALHADGTRLAAPRLLNGADTPYSDALENCSDWSDHDGGTAAYGHGEVAGADWFGRANGQLATACALLNAGFYCLEADR